MTRRMLLLSILSVSFALSATGPEIFTTNRMTAYRIHESHLNDIYTLTSDPQVGESLHHIFSLDETKDHLKSSLEHWSKCGFGSYVFYDTQTGNFIGMIELILCPEDLSWISINKGEVLLNYVIMPKYWNSDLATEMTQATIKRCFEQLSVEGIVAFTDASNIASQRVLEKTGFTFIGIGSGNRIVLYRLAKKAV